jgi:predicted secreted protein
MMINPDWRRCSAVAMGVVFALAGGCSSAPAPKPPAPPPARIEQPGKKAITVSVAESGASIVLDRSQELLVRLPTSPTSRLEWAPVDLRPGVLTVRRSGYDETAWSPSVEQGTAGTAYWDLIPQAAGQVTLRFDLRQPHRLDAAVQTVTYTVIVK